jgi:hypothetical protein
MRHLVLGCLLLASTLAVAGGLQLGVSGERFDQLTTTRSSAFKVTSNAVPIFAVRIDDIRESVVDNDLYKPFLELGIPVTFSINYDKLGTGDYATVAEVQAMFAEFDEAGVPYEIANHGNGNFGDGTPWDNDYDTWYAEFDPSNLIEAFGKPVPTIVQVGGGAQREFAAHNRGYLQMIAEQFGYEYWDQGYGTPEEVPFVIWEPSSQFSSFAGASNPTDAVRGAIFPGCCPDPLWLPNGITMDLADGPYFERDASDEWGATRYDDFTIDDDTALTPANAWKSTFQYLHERYLVNQWGAVYAIHDSVLSEADNGDTRFSPHKMAWRLNKDRENGLLRLGTVSEVYDWGMSGWAPKTDLVSFPEGVLPAEAAGDTSGIEYGWVMGWGSWNGQSGAWTNNQSNLWANGTNGKFGYSGGAYRAGHPFLNVGPDHVNAVNATSLTIGGVAMNVTTSLNNFSRTNLSPGWYRLTVIHDDDDFQVRQLEVAAVRKYMSFENGAFHNGTSAFTTEGEMIWWESTNTGNINMASRVAAANDQNNSASWLFHLPAQPESWETFADGFEVWDSADRAGYTESIPVGTPRYGIQIELGFNEAGTANWLQLTYMGPPDY